MIVFVVTSRYSIKLDYLYLTLRCTTLRSFESTDPAGTVFLCSLSRSTMSDSENRDFLSEARKVMISLLILQHTGLPLIYFFSLCAPLLVYLFLNFSWVLFLSEMANVIHSCRGKIKP